LTIPTGAAILTLDKKTPVQAPERTHPVFPPPSELPARWIHCVPFGWRILGAIGIWIVGSRIMRFIATDFGRMLAVRIVDLAPGRYLEASERRGSRT
jgi:hypothetical protein